MASSAPPPQPPGDESWADAVVTTTTPPSSSSSSSLAPPRVHARRRHETEAMEMELRGGQQQQQPFVLLEEEASLTRSPQQCKNEASLCEEWIHECVWPGMGLFGESYLLFSLGTLTPLWEVLFPACWTNDDYDDNDASCRPGVLRALSYSAVLGVIVGMIVLGFCANRMGRRLGSLTTAAFMSIGAVCLTLASLLLVTQPSNDDDDVSINLTSNPERLVVVMSVALFLFGLGVGGEYPLAAASASEKAMGQLKRRQRQELFQQQQQSSQQPSNNSSRSSTEDSSSDDSAWQQEHRGRKVQLVFTMQGMGIFCNSLTMTALFVIYGQDGDDDYDKSALVQIWRITYAIGAGLLVYVWVGRYLYLPESTVWQQDQKERKLLQRNTESPVPDPASGRPPLPTGNNNNSEAIFRKTASVDLRPSPSNMSHISTVSSLSIPSVEDPHHFHHYHAPAPIPQTHQQGSDNQQNVSSMTMNTNTMLWPLREVPSTDSEEARRSSIGMLVLRNYGVRLLGVSACWMLWDVAFYGNKLFQSTFLRTLTGKEQETTLLQFSLAATLNAAVALLGYFGAALLIDHPEIGRRRLQQWGFLVTGCLFVACGFLYQHLSSAFLVLMYLGSSFFGQLGPNATTFLIPAEVFPTAVRTACHGMAAASGKMGALMAAIVFSGYSSHAGDDSNYGDDDNDLSTLDMFLLSGYASFAAAAVTFWTIPETVGLDLYELDKKWHLILDGRKAEYQGPANHPQFLSFYERYKLSFQQQSANHYNHAADAF